MKPEIFLLTALQCVFNIGGAALLKLALNEKSPAGFWEFLAFLCKFKALAGIAAIAAGFGLTLLLLSKIDLSTYQPLSSALSFLITIAFSVALLGERITLYSIGGMTLIALGIWVIDLGVSS